MNLMLRRATPRAGLRCRRARSAATGFPQAIRVHRRRTTSRSGEYQAVLAVLAGARVRRSRDRAPRRALAREALFDAANAESACDAGGEPVAAAASAAVRPRVRSQAAGKSRARRCRSAISCAAAFPGATVASRVNSSSASPGTARVARRRRRSTRPHVAARLLGRKPAVDASPMVPLLFTSAAVRRAQRGRRACGGRRDGDASRRRPPRRTRASLESLQEYLWRLLIDWPHAMGSAADVDAGRGRAARDRRVDAPARRPRGAERRAARRDARRWRSARIAATRSFGIAPASGSATARRRRAAAWAQPQHRCRPSCSARCSPTARARRSDVALMPRRAGALARHRAGAAQRAGFCARADLERRAGRDRRAGSACATHPLVAACMRLRQRVRRAVRRAVGRTGALLRARPAQRTERWRRRGPGIALGAGRRSRRRRDRARPAPALRRVATTSRVADYRIVAPTEWNFHPRGALARGLAGIAADDERRLAPRQARSRCNRSIPASPADIEVGHA